MPGKAPKADRISVRLEGDTLAHLDAYGAARGLKRSEALRVLLQQAIDSPTAPADHTEALLLLSESARAGSVQARIALARVTRPDTAKSPTQRRRDELALRRAARS